MSEKKSRRVFIGIKASSVVQEKISDWRKSFKTLPVRWIGKEDLHITLIPPWLEKDIESVSEKLNYLCQKIRPFNIEINKITYAPTDKKPSLIWAEIVPSPELNRLKKGLEDVLGKDKSSPFPVFRPHITIARFENKNFKYFPVRKLDERVSWKKIVEKITIFESPALGGSGYKIICEIPLLDEPREKLFS